jgi:hypothetical protein
MKTGGARGRVAQQGQIELLVRGGSPMLARIVFAQFADDGGRR